MHIDESRPEYGLTRRNMFAQADHDAGAVTRVTQRAVASCFWQGEIGPAGGRTFVHGITVSIAAW